MHGKRLLMKNNFTHSVPEKNYQEFMRGMKKQVRPRKKTIDSLKLFARNYQINSELPEGLQGFIVG